MAVGQERVMTAEQESELMELRHEAREAEAEWTEKDRIAKAAKKAMEAANDAVNSFIDDLGNPTPRLKFGDDADPLAGDAPAKADAVPVAPSEDGEAYPVLEDDERWRAVPIQDLAQYGIKPGDVKKLAEATPPITTMGELADFSASGVKRLTDIPGIGEAANDRIVDAVIGFHAAHPRQKAPGVPPEQSSDEPDRSDLEGPEGTSGDGLGDETAVRAETSDADRQPIRQRKDRKPKPEPEAVLPLPLDPEQAERDEMDRMHLEAERPEEFSESSEIDPEDYPD